MARVVLCAQIPVPFSMSPSPMSSSSVAASCPSFSPDSLSLASKSASVVGFFFFFFFFLMPERSSSPSRSRVPLSSTFASYRTRLEVRNLSARCCKSNLLELELVHHFVHFTNRCRVLKIDALSLRHDGRGLSRCGILDFDSHRN